MEHPIAMVGRRDITWGNKRAGGRRKVETLARMLVIGVEIGSRRRGNHDEMERKSTTGVNEKKCRQTVKNTHKR